MAWPNMAYVRILMRCHRQGEHCCVTVLSTHGREREFPTMRKGRKLTVWKQAASVELTSDTWADKRTSNISLLKTFSASWKNFTLYISDRTSHLLREIALLTTSLFRPCVHFPLNTSDCDPNAMHETSAFKTWPVKSRGEPALLASRSDIV